jgi:phosphoglycerol transferase MdoB-like AlkP superfamily enzyme
MSKLKRLLPAFYTIAGALIIATGWAYYHLDKHNLNEFVVKTLGLALFVAIAFRVGLLIFDKLFPRFKRHPFWHTHFRQELNELFFASSLLFGVFFIRVELYSLAYALLVLLLLYFMLKRIISHHPANTEWLLVHKAIARFCLALFALEATAQYLSYRWYILDSSIKFYDIVLFRSFAMVAVWLLGFALAGICFVKIKSRWRGALLGTFAVLFLGFLFFWIVNLSTLYYAGLYFDPTALNHLHESGGLFSTSAVYAPVLGLFGSFVLFCAALWQLWRTHVRTVNKQQWYSYYGALIAVSILALVSFSSLKNTPEHSVVKSFYDYYLKEDRPVALSPIIVNKLHKFGLFYNPDTFYVAEHKNVFDASKGPLLPKKFAGATPNVIIIFLESYSARLTSVYNPRFPGLTPGLEKMASATGTTVFRNYFNASTPTVTGLLSQLCSLLPPTGHNEIQNDKKLQRHRLLCLPEVLKRNGFAYTGYVTAVEKDFANKDGIFGSMGTDEVFGTEELKQHISGMPLSWGYSDHQMFPFLWDLAQEKPQPYLLMLSTVDTHPPFNLSKDEVKYGDGSNQVLTAFHTTDDAFLQFWNSFRSSTLAQNTILIAVADHAVFPGAYDRKTFPQEAGKLNFYDQNTFLMYVPDSVLPKNVDTYASSLDVTPTLLHILGYNTTSSFEGHSIFDDQSKYPSLLGMHELGLYINQITASGTRKMDYNLPTEIKCPANYSPSSTPDLTECDYLLFYTWKRQMFEEGRFWKR